MVIDPTTHRVNPDFRINPQQKLFTAPQFRHLVKNHKQTQKDGIGGHAPVVKFFGGSSSTWLISEVDPKTGIALGLCDLGFGSPELGYVDLQELADIRFPLGLHVERDLYFKSQKTMKEYADEARNEGRIIA